MSRIGFIVIGMTENRLNIYFVGAAAGMRSAMQLQTMQLSGCKLEDEKHQQPPGGSPSLRGENHFRDHVQFRLSIQPDPTNEC